MKKINIFIDHTGDDDDTSIAKKIKDRLKGIKYDFSIIMFDDFETSEANWEKVTVKAINQATIVIPIISADYISYVSGPIEKTLDKITDSKDRYLFPIYYKPAEWGAFNWIVRSKLTPSDEQPLSEYSTNDSDRIISELIKTITNVVIKYYSQDNKQTDLETIKPVESNVLFISHDHDDADFAELLKLKLEKQGLNSWIDSERLKIGQDWREEIDSGIEKSMAVIAIMTPDSRKSEYVTYEWAYAWGKGKKVFPIMLKQTQLHPRLESLQYLDFTNRASRPWDKLISSIKELK